MARRTGAGAVRRIASRAGRARSFRRPSTRVEDWRTPVDGRAPRLGPREYIGHDIRGRGAWKGRDPLTSPVWWAAPRWVAVVGWAALTAGSGFIAWRRHGGKAFLFSEQDAR